MTQFNLAEAIRLERLASRGAGRAFAEAVEAGNADKLLEAADRLVKTTDGWRFAFRYVAKAEKVSPAIRDAFLTIWIEHKNLSLRIGQRPTVAGGLRVLMPRNYQGGPLRIYRGAVARERKVGYYGFSWSTDQAVAHAFAKKRQTLGGIVLSTVAPPDAILLHLENENVYDEREVVVDPYLLGKVAVVERIEAT
jgi:hypothetical protein